MVNKKSMIQMVLWVTIPLFIIDQISKWWIVMNYAEPFPGFEPTKVIIEGYFNIVRRHNQGVAFGMGNGSTWAPIVFLFVPIIAIFLVSYFWKKGAFTGPSKWAPPLLLAGVFGNLTDRLLQGFFLSSNTDEPFFTRLLHGYVVDFIDVTIPFINYRWPAFNVADSCICIAASLLFISALLEGKDELMAKKQAEAE
ncbi:signal peptidase II [Persicirhabdus sediminis]|uniref:Lipoprotein signal peptidase n=2 Tax=Persicirhabdus sediminis TaxID=454144 RepID=A0A8J7MCB8_9BACT|nr:signal peptidase II [Persicirhabdus sediminis]